MLSAYLFPVALLLAHVSCLRVAIYNDPNCRGNNVCGNLMNDSGKM
jgi:hypothetical protein